MSLKVHARIHGHFLIQCARLKEYFTKNLKCHCLRVVSNLYATLLFSLEDYEENLGIHILTMYGKKNAFFQNFHFSVEQKIKQRPGLEQHKDE